MADETKRELRDRERDGQGIAGKSRLAAAKWYLLLAAVVAVVAFTWYQVGNLPGAGTGVKGELHHQDFADQGRTHIPEGSKTPEVYNSNPPTSGPHYPTPADWGIYDKEQPDERMVHNLEHGGVWISYKNLDEESLSKLKELVRGFKSKVILTPRAANDNKIALSAWTHLDKFEDYDEGRIRAFIDAYKDRGPEFFPD